MKNIVKIVALVLAFSAVFCLAACKKKENVKKAILVVSFGTSYNDSREKTIGAIEAAISKAYPDYEVRRAFTADTIINILKERDNIQTDNVHEAMERLVADGFKEVIIQPTHIMSGYEYDDVVKEVSNYKDKFDSFKISKTMLTTDEDYNTMVNILSKADEEFGGEGTAIVYMGHGTEHESNATYANLQKKLTDAGKTNIFIGTVEAEPSVEDVVALAKEGGYKKVVLIPLMIVCGDHANNDMAGDEEDSWKSIFEAEGFEVQCVLRGLGENADIQQLVVKHCGEAIKG
ncbi:MAG: sirohydrochlorin cobaltochelatase [Clostridia bacterium]|nr:sirohydrochlorin cobaltochelatase [Clostridia bacterium]